MLSSGPLDSPPLGSTDVSAKSGSLLARSLALIYAVAATMSNFAVERTSNSNGLLTPARTSHHQPIHPTIQWVPSWDTLAGNLIFGGSRAKLWGQTLALQPTLEKGRK